jgi:hypothetical protein
MTRRNRSWITGPQAVRAASPFGWDGAWGEECVRRWSREGDPERAYALDKGCAFSAFRLRSSIRNRWVTRFLTWCAPGELRRGRRTRVRLARGWQWPNLTRGPEVAKIAPSHEPGQHGARTRRMGRVLFASAHSIVDFSNGASVATLDVLQGLTAAGFECQAFCTSKLDLHTDVCFEEVVDAMGEPHQVRPSTCGSQRARILYTRRQRVPIRLSTNRDAERINV